MADPSQVPDRPTVVRAILATWLVTAAWDFCCATALNVGAYRIGFARFWQGVASVPFGPQMLNAGARGVAAGIVAHLATAFTWSALFVAALALSPGLRRRVARPGGAVLAACLYGPAIWLVMSLGVIPLLTGRAPAFNFRWWVQVLAHVPFVTLPLVFTARRSARLA